LHTVATSSELLTATKRFPIRSISFHPQLFRVSLIANVSANSSDPGRPDNRSITKSRNSSVSDVHHAIRSRVAFERFQSSNVHSSGKGSVMSKYSDSLSSCSNGISASPIDADQSMIDEKSPELFSSQ